MNRRVMYGFKDFISLDEAIKKFRENIKICNLIEYIDVKDSLGRISSEDLFSPIDLPYENRSVVDGYAVRSIDVSGASPNNPIQLKIVGKVYADKRYNGKIIKNQAVVIFTGGYVPDGADCVLMAEDCKVDGDELIVYKQCFPLQNISKRGEDFGKGDLVIKRGTKIKPFHIGALLSLGIKKINVYVKARIAVIATGSEIHDIDEDMEGIIDSTRPMILSLIKDFGLIPVDMGIVPDDPEMIKTKIIESLKKSDMVVITGGTSVGEHDLVPDLLESITSPGIIVHGISMRPARTTGFAFNGNIPILMISGFPVAAYISFNIFLKEFVEKFYGTTIDPTPIVKGRLTMRLPNQAGTKSFVRVVVKRINNEYYVEPLRLTGSGILSTLTKANGILVVDENSEGFEEGEYVDVILTQPPEVGK